jgi:hypothetical protein
MEAFLSGAMPNLKFVMPGCRLRHTRHRGGRRYRGRR